ncbi:MAG: haloacid dehalogenase, partial [Candidatus Electrothrix sp. AR3]|nr:haloacid dehalogenase [Candidatus Electrothrix sp. AR3]
KKHRVPFPDVLIADVGTTVCYREQGQWRHDMDWDEQLSRDWHQIDSKGIAELLHGLHGLHIQEEDRQTRFKLSYYVDAEADKSRLARTISSIFEQRNIQATQIWSHDETAEQELLDILPKNADKYQALQFLRRQMGYSLSEMLFAGDSGNDLEVLASEIPAVLVANARQEVADKALEMAATAENSAGLYLARGGYLEMNGCYTAGILEGVAHYYPDFF